MQVSYEALKKRYDQGWVLEIIDDLDQLIERVKEARQKKQVWRSIIIFNAIQVTVSFFK